MENRNELNSDLNLNSKNGGITFSLNVLLYIAVSLAAGIIALAFKLENGSDGFIYLSYILAQAGVALTCLISTKKICKVPFKSVVKVKCSPKYFLIAIMAIFGLLFSLGWVNDLSVALFKLFGYTPRESYLPDVSGAKVIPALLVIALLPAVFEEFLFRGLLLGCLKNQAGSVRSVFIVGFCFALFHASPEQTIYQFFAGCVFTLIAERSGSLAPTVVMHFINNAVIVIFQACGLFDESGALAVPAAVNITLIIVGAVCLIGALVWLILDKTPKEKCREGGVKNFFIFASSGIAVLALIWILSLFGVA